MNKENFLAIIRESNSVTDIAISLGHKYYYDGRRLSGTAYRDVRAKCAEFGIDYSDLSCRKKECFEDSDITRAVAESSSIAEVMRNLEMNETNGTKRRNLRYRIKSLGLDTSHFSGQLWSKGKTRITDKRLDLQARKIQKPSKNVFVKGTNASNASLLKRLVLEKGVPYKCDICGIKKWNGQNLRLRLDHKDGDSTNGEESNLRLLCPNCDSQTETFCRGQRKRNKSISWWQQV